MGAAEGTKAGNRHGTSGRESRQEQRKQMQRRNESMKDSGVICYLGRASSRKRGR